MFIDCQFWLLLLPVLILAFLSSTSLAQKNASFSTVRRKRIVGGERSSIADAPFVVQLIRGDSVKCTGSIIASDVIITAAHCTKDSVDSVVYGTCRKYSRSNSRGTFFNHNNVKMVKVLRTHVHPSYINGVDRNDIALLELAEPIPLSEYSNTDTVELEPDEGTCGDWVQVYGFGDTHSWYDSGASQKMQSMMTRVENGCYQSERHRNFIVTQIEGKTVCHGDSGGPLINNQRQIIGILSGTSQTGCIPGDLNLFVKISNHAEFIEKYFYDKLYRDQQRYKPNTDSTDDHSHRRHHNQQQQPNNNSWSSSANFLGLDCTTLERLLNRFRSFRSAFSRRVLQQYETLCLSGNNRK